MALQGGDSASAPTVGGPTASVGCAHLTVRCLAELTTQVVPCSQPPRMWALPIHPASDITSGWVHPGSMHSTLRHAMGGVALQHRGGIHGAELP